jgi:hypothetical protein
MGIAYRILLGILKSLFGTFRRWLDESIVIQYFLEE